MTRHSRREFLQNSSLLLAGAGLASVPFSSALAAKRVAPSDKIVVGLIGARGMGWANLTSHLKNPGVECVALADVDDEVLQNRSNDLQKLTGKKAHLHKDFRKLLENKDIDAVIIGTPDHWHCLQTVLACQAGKDVYVEKPLANSIEECNIMVAAAKRHNRVVQVGQWQRSGPHWISALDYIHSGKLGKIGLVKTWLYQRNARPLPVVPNTAPPANLDYEMWLGPARPRPYNPVRLHGSWRYFWDYGGGLMTDWGVHLLDIAFPGMKAPVASSAVSSGGKYAFPDSAMETPDTQQAIFSFADYTILWEHGFGVSGHMYGTDHHGVAFIGSEGTLVIDRSKWFLLPETKDGQYLIPAVPHQTAGSQTGLNEHVENFLQCIKTREKPRCDIASARDVAVNCHLGNIAYRTGRKVYWDDAKNSFGSDKEANAFVRPTYHGPWKLPKIA
ncbi:Gfo/Idh/MocA family oxidoreductase [soil metagenome]